MKKFIFAALPWVLIGLALAVLAVNHMMEKQKDEKQGRRIALVLMIAGAIGTGVVPPEYFGIPERFSVFAAAGFQTVLGIYLFCSIMKEENQH